MSHFIYLAKEKEYDLLTERLDTLEKAFEELSLLENGEFTQEDNRYRAHDGEVLYSNTYLLRFNYREIEFIVRNEIGHQDIGNISCNLALQDPRMEFKIASTNGLILFFYQRAEALKIQNKYPPFRNFVEINRAYIQLAKYAKENAFSPTIAGKNNKDIFTVECTYGLGFKHKGVVLTLLITFLKSIADFLKDHRPIC